MAEKYDLKDKLQFLQQIKIDALLLQNNRQSEDFGEAVLIESEIEELVNAFYEGCRDFISRDQCEAAKQDFDVFLRLIDSALSRYRDSSLPHHSL